jgi:NADPH:quinone reductase-like Zn-dependent oxidoreductase
MSVNYGVLVKDWPIGLGADASGVIEEVGEEASKTYGFKKGDYVCGCTRIGWPPEYSTCREYFLMDAPVTMRKPSQLTPAEACTVGAAFQTAALGLFDGLQLSEGGASNKDWVLVCGGSGSVGGAAVKLANACGYRVVATCSKTNFDKVKSSGAEVTVDYRQ